MGKLRNRMKSGHRQFLKRQFNKMAEERRCRRAEEDKAGNSSIVGKSLLDQKPEKIKVSPIVRYRHVCPCGHEFVADNREATCRRCGGNMLTVTMVREDGRLFEYI